MIAPPWSFPVVIPIGGVPVPAHALTDLLSYGIGFRLYLWLQRRSAGRMPVRSFEERAWLFLGCIVGALLGAKLLAWAEAPGIAASLAALRHDSTAWMAGKTIVGGLLGGWAGIEVAKKALGIGESTGDLYVFPLLLGIAVGRIGCFLAGPGDDTWGGPTALPWGVDPGDGIPRHPSPLYEIAFLAALALVLWRLRGRLGRPGALFRLFLAGYLGFRFAAEFLKPHGDYWLGLSAIQWACLLALPLCLRFLIRPSHSHA